VLLAFYDDPAEHWIHLRTTNPTESTSPSLGRGSESPRARAREQPASQWRSSSSSPHKPAGAPSMPLTSSHSSAPEPGSKKAHSSNDPTTQEVISKSRDTPIHRPPSSRWVHPVPLTAQLEPCGTRAAPNRVADPQQPRVRRAGHQRQMPTPVHRTLIACSAEKPAVPKKSSPLRSSVSMCVVCEERPPGRWTVGRARVDRL
jgi:hypothetical protein